jgi:hypothetical protein
MQYAEADFRPYRNIATIPATSPALDGQMSDAA